MAKVMIRQLEERVATNGLFMGSAPGDKFRRKLQPGEIVEIDKSMLNDEGENLFEQLWATGTIDLVPDHVPVTRPLDYENRREAMLCSPTYKSRGADDDRIRDQVRAKVEARLIEQSESQPDEVESPEEDTPAELPPPVAASTVAKRRVRRGARPKADQHGAQATT